MAPRRFFALTLVAACALALTACGEDSPGAEPDAPTSSATTTSTAPTEEPTEQALGPVQTVRAWVDGYNAVVRSGDTTDIYVLSSDDCESCAERVEPVADTHRDGGRYEGYRWAIQRITRDRQFAQNRTIHTTIRHSAGTTWPSAGADPVSYEAQLQLASFELVKEGEQWLVRTIFHPA